MFLSFVYVVAVGLALAGAMTLVIALLNYLFDLDLGLGIGGFDIALPDEPGLVVALAIVLFILAGLLWAVAEYERVLTWARARPLAAFAVLVTPLVAVGLFLYQMAGGPLGLAVENGDLEKVRQALAEQQYKPEQLNPHLYQALRKGHLDLARALLEAGADPNSRSGEFSTPLLGAAVTWFPDDAVLLLLEKGADPDQADKMGRTPALLMLLYRAGNFPGCGDAELAAMLTRFQQSGADLKKAADNGDTVASVAETRKFEHCLMLLRD